MKRRQMVATLIAVVLLIGASSAYAFNIVTCNGAKLKWPGNSANAKMTRNMCSVPDGSSQAGAYFSAINRWNLVRGMWDKLDPAFAWPSDHCFMEFDDGQNDFALVDVAQIDGLLGATVVFRNCPDIYEVDILMANLDRQNFDNPDEAFAIGTGTNPTGRFATLHEFGHGLGLSVQPKGSSVDAHVTGYAVMQGSAPNPLAGGLGQQHARVMPDDAAGVRFLYPSGKNEFNLMASAQSLTGTTVVNNTPPGTVTRCRGGSVTFTWSLLNAGTTNVTSDQRFFIATSPTAHNQPGVTLGTWFGATVNAQSAVFPSVTLKIPCGTAPGLYFLFHQVDSSNKFGEWNESDNVVHLPMTIQVNKCGC